MRAAFLSIPCFSVSAACRTFALLLTVFSLSATAQLTSTQTPPIRIDAVQINTGQYASFDSRFRSDPAYYLINKTGLGAPGCETANIVRILHKDMYEIAFYAYTAGRNVVIYGTCFSAEYLVAGAILVPPSP